MNYDSIKRQLSRADALAREGKLAEAHSIVTTCTDGGASINDVHTNLSRAALKSLRDFVRSQAANATD